MALTPLVIAALLVAVESAAPVPERPTVCETDALTGSWRAAGGLTLRFSGPYGLHQGAAVVVAPGAHPVVAGEVMYDGARAGSGCRFLTHRRLMLDLNLHAAPPHVVALELDPDRGTLTDRYSGDSLVFTRVEP